MTHLIIAILILCGPRPYLPSDSTWVIQSYSSVQPYRWSHGEDVRALPGPCLWTYHSDGRLVCHVLWDYNADSVLTMSDLGYFGLEYSVRWNLSDFALFADGYQQVAVVEVVGWLQVQPDSLIIVPTTDQFIECNVIWFGNKPRPSWQAIRAVMEVE